MLPALNCWRNINEFGRNVDNKEKVFISIENFKCLFIKDLELKPLTFLFGKNGSGKSSFIKAVKFLSHNLFSIWDELHQGGPDSEKYYYKIDDNLDLQSYSEIVLNNDISKKIIFEIKFINAALEINHLMNYYDRDTDTDISSDNSFYSIVSSDNVFEIVKDEQKENEFWESLGKTDWKKADEDQSLMLDFKVIVEFSNNRSLIITILDISNDFQYKFAPNTYGEENYYSYWKIVSTSDTEKNDFLTDLYTSVNAMPFLDGLGDNYKNREESKIKIIKDFKESLLSYLYKNQNHKFWGQLTPDEKRASFYSKLKEFLIIFILIPEKLETYFKKVIHLPSIRELPKPMYLLTEGRFDGNDYYGLLREFDPDDNQSGIWLNTKYVEADGVPVDSVSKFINYYLKENEAC